VPIQQQSANFRIAEMIIAAGLYLLLLCGHILLPAAESFALFLAVAMCTASVVVARLLSSGKHAAARSQFPLPVDDRFAGSVESDLSDFAEYAVHAESDDAALIELEAELELLEDQLHRDVAALEIPMAAGAEHSTIAEFRGYS